MRYLALFVLFAASVANADGPSLKFLGHANSNEAWALDSNFDPTLFTGPLDPPYEVGANALTRIDLATGEVTASIALGGDAPVLAFDLSPDGDTALAVRIFDNALLVINGISDPSTATVREYPLPMQPLSLAISSDGQRAAIGYQGGAGEAHAGLVDGLRGTDLRIHPPVSLGIDAGYLTAVEAVDFSLDGTRLVTQSALHDVAPPDPVYFMPRIVVQSNVVWGENIVAGAPFVVDRTPVLPPAPPFAGAPTGVALGDFALTCDGRSLLLPVSGALDVGQPDARILVLDGVELGQLTERRVLTPADGVSIAPFQVALAPDCDSAIVTNAFAGNLSVMSGIRSGEVSIESATSSMPFPSEAVISADLAHVAVQHSRPPIDGVPPTSVTFYDYESLQATQAPLFGPVRSWIQAKDRTLAAWPAGLLDRIAAADPPDWIMGMYERSIGQVQRLSRAGYQKRAIRLITWLRIVTYTLEYAGYLDSVDADVIQVILYHALRAQLIAAR